MPTLRVFAHWSTAPGVPSPSGLTSPFPAQFAGYPGAPPPSIGGPPGPPLYTLWCELAPQTDIDAVGWSGPAWPGPQPPGPDQGYDPAAIGFQVTQVSIVGVAGPVGPDFVYTIRPPGQPPFTVGPPGYSHVFAAPFDGRGIWVIEVNFAPGSPGTAASSEFLGPPPIREPYFSPYGAPQEGICAVEFEGKEIYGTTTTTTTAPPTTTTSTTTTSTTTTVPPVCHTVQVQVSCPCSSGGAAVTCQFTAVTSPATPAYAGSYTWKLERRTGTGPWQVLQSITKSGAGANTHSYASFTPGDYKVSVIILTPGCDDPVASDFDEFTVLDCDCPTITGTIQATQTANPCVWNFNVLVNNPQNLAVEYDWVFGDGTTQTTTGPSTTHTYTTSGPMTVSVTVRATQRTDCRDTETIQINVDCPGTTTSTTSTTSGPTTTTTTTTVPPDTTTSSTTTGTTTSTTTTPTTTPGGPGMGCACIILLILALAFIALAAAAILAWACTGFSNAVLLGIAIGAAILGLIFLILWILVCAAAACDVLFLLIDIFTILVAVMPIVALIFAILGLPNCGLGALINAGYFALVLSVLYRGGEIVGCIVRRS
ncbi:MAG: PKD domain-containing protein [Actinomycetota bacterium]